jgi:long-chain acyl-CoA synthetase
LNVAAMLRAAARVHGSRPALARGTTVLADYRRFARDVAALAGALRTRLGLGPGDRVVIAMNNGAAFQIAEWACWHAGLSAVAVNAKLHPREIGYIVENSGARRAFVDDAPASKARSRASPAPSACPAPIGGRSWLATRRLLPRSRRRIPPGSSIPAARPEGPRAPR